MGKLDDLTISLAAETTFRTCHRWLHASREGVEQVAWRRPWSTSTRPARQGEDGDDAYYAPARYSPLGALSPAPSGLRWTSPLPVAPWSRLGRPRGRAGRALVVETSTPAAGDRSVYPVGRSPGQGAGSGGPRSDSGSIPNPVPLGGEEGRKGVKAVRVHAAENLTSLTSDGVASGS